MLTAVIRTHARAGPLAATLSALVPGVVQGLVSHAVVVEHGEQPDCRRIADAMGATIIRAEDGATPARSWSAGIAAARTPWVLLLDAGDVPEEGWVGAVERHLVTRTLADAPAPGPDGHQDAGRDVALMAAAGPFGPLAARARALFAAGPHAGCLMPRGPGRPPRWPRLLSCRRLVIREQGQGSGRHRPGRNVS
jgi:hypothetical protein